jgi:hypothetical protein
VDTNLLLEPVVLLKDYFFQHLTLTKCLCHLMECYRTYNQTMYFSDLSLSSEGSSGRIEVERETSSRYNKRRSTRGEKIIRKFDRRMEFFLAKGGSCSYDDENIDDIEVPIEVQTSSETMGTQGYSSNKH